MKNIQEAHRYLDNAKEILRDKALKEDGFYQDKKYVKMAGNTAYNGVLEALDGLFGIKKKGRKSVDWYLLDSFRKSATGAWSLTCA